MGACKREWRAVVIEHRSCPRCGRVACGARGRESGRDVIRIYGSCVVRLVTGVAISRNSCVIVVDVTEGARGSHMRAGEREGRFRVIEGRRDPAAGGMADGAIRGESRCDVIGTVGGTEVRFVA